MLDLTLSKILIWLATGGSVLAVSYACEQWNLFHTLTSLQKRFAMWVSASSLGVGSLWVTVNVPAETLAIIAGYLQPVIVAFALIFLQEKFHAASKVEQARGQ